MGISSDPSLEKLLLFQPENLSDHQPPCVTRTLLLLSSTMAPACARPASPVMTPPGLSSPPSLDAPGIRVSWWVWDRRTPMLETRPSPRGVTIYSAGFFLTVSTPSMLKTAKHCASVGKTY